MARVLGLLLVLSALIWSMTGESGVFNRAMLRDSSTGTVTSFSDLLSFTPEAACLLGPYADRLPADEPWANRINGYLASTGFAADESDYAFVLVAKEKVELVGMRRSRQLDILGRHEIERNAGIVLPQGFVARNCASGESAAVTKVLFQNRVYVVFGEVG